jgi:hypothetical protein
MGYVVAILSLSLVGVGVWLALWISRLKGQIADLDRKRVVAEIQGKAAEDIAKQLSAQRDAALKAFDDLSRALAETPDDASSIADRLRRNFP